MALVVRSLDQPGRMIGVAKGDMSQRVQTDDQLLNSLRGYGQPLRNYAAAHWTIEQIE